MNDPRVVALLYRVKHSKAVSYESTAPMTHETSKFLVHVSGAEARFELREDFATAEAAREIVEPFIRQWELGTTLDRGPGEFELKFVGAQIEDRRPTPGQPSVALSATEYGEVLLSHIVRRARYPQPYETLGFNPAVEALVHRYARFREDRDTLAGMAYFCLTILENTAGGRPGAKEKYGVASTVLSTLGRLTGEKGGLEARKADGLSQDFSSAERDWLESAINRLIRRAAETAHDPSAARSQITMADLPPL